MTVHGDTPLMTACFSGHLRCAHLLIRAGADLNRQNAFGHTAVMKSAFKGRTFCLTLLLGAGADPFIQDKKGATAKDIASTAGHTDICKLLDALSPGYSLLAES